MTDIDFDLDLTFEDTTVRDDGDFTERPSRDSTETAVHASEVRYETRRAMSERKLSQEMGFHLEKGKTYHCISGGDVDSLSYLRHIVRQQPLRYCLISTWVLGKADAEEIASWKKKGYVDRFDFYVGEYFANGDRESRMDTYEMLKDIAAPEGRVCIHRNHSKVMVGFGRDYDFAICSSANVNTNPRIENTTVTIDTDVARFYKEFYDSLNAYNAGYDDWIPWSES